MLFRKASALVATALVGSFAFSDASTAGQVKMEAELGQTVIASGGTDRIYLRINLEGIAAPSEGRRTPANVALVIDRSGSMNGEKIRQARKAAITEHSLTGHAHWRGSVTAHLQSSSRRAM